jgi:hypothetical protein
LKLFYRGKDGGTESTVWGFWLVEIKSLFSVALLKFVGKSREAFHNHAFDSISWVLRGQLRETLLTDDPYCQIVNVYRPSPKPVITRRDTFHQVDSVGTTWVFTLRGPWLKTWEEFRPNEDRFVTLTHGRKEVA